MFENRGGKIPNSSGTASGSISGDPGDLQRHSPDQERLPEPLRRAEKLVQDNKRGDARAEYTKYIKSHPEDPRGYLARGNFERQFGVPEFAIKDYEELTRRWPQVARYHFILGREIAGFDDASLQSQTNDGISKERSRKAVTNSNRAIGELEKALTITPNAEWKVDALLLIGSESTQLGQYAKSEMAFAAAIRIDPGNREAHVGRICNNIARGKTSGLLEDIRSSAKTASLDGFDIDVIVSALRNSKIRNPAMELAVLTDAIKRDPSSSSLRESRGNLYLELKQVKQAIVDFKAAWEIAREPQAKFQLARAYLADSPPRDDLALPILNETIKDSPHFQYALSVRAELFERRGDYQAAVRDRLELIRFQGKDWVHSDHTATVRRLLDPSTKFVERQESYTLNGTRRTERVVDVITSDPSDPKIRFSSKEYLASISPGQVSGVTLAFGENPGIVIQRDGGWIINILLHELAHYSGKGEVGARISANPTLDPFSALSQVFRAAEAYGIEDRIVSVMEYGAITGKLALNRNSKGQLDSVSMSKAVKELLPGRKGYQELDLLATVQLKPISTGSVADAVEEFIAKTNRAHYLNTFKTQNGRTPIAHDRQFLEQEAEQNYLNRRYDAALTLYDKAIGINPGSSNLYLLRGEAKAALGRHQEAITDYKKAIQIRTAVLLQVAEPGNINSEKDLKLERQYSLLGNSQVLLGMHAEAKKSWDQANNHGHK